MKISMLAVEGADRPVYLYADQYRDFSHGGPVVLHPGVVVQARLREIKQAL